MSTRSGERRTAGSLEGDAGLTLPELLVTMLLLSILGSIVSGMYAATTHALTRSSIRTDDTRAAQIAMETLTKNLRAATAVQRSGQTALAPFVTATSTSVSVYAAVGASPSKITYTVDSSRRLIETRVAADAPATGPYYTFTGAGVTRIVASGVLNTTADPLFVYRNASGVVVNASGGGAALFDVAGVDIALTIRAGSSTVVPNARLEQQIYLPNVESGS